MKNECLEFIDYKYTENQIAEQMKIDVDEVRNILEKFKE